MRLQADVSVLLIKLLSLEKIPSLISMHIVNSEKAAAECRNVFKIVINTLVSDLF